MTAQPRFVLVPSLECPAECLYCFGPREGPSMSPETIEAALDFIAKIAGETGQQKVRITFHGGEPLTAGHRLFRLALEGLEARFGPGAHEVGLQSNLWLLDDQFLQMFSEHDVEIGTSLDGPEEITDAQRGVGHFARTMRGIEVALKPGLKVGCIATFTPISAPRWREILDFFRKERLGLSIRASVPRMGSEDNGRSLSVQDYASLLREALFYYIEHRLEMVVSSLDQMCQGVAFAEGKVCTFRDCLGMLLAIDPVGDIYPCQRFCGLPTYRLGNLADNPTLSELLDSPMGRRMAEREAKVGHTCAECEHIDYCRGGCAYNAWSGGDPARIRDPYCEAYRAIFACIKQRLVQEMNSEANVKAIASAPISTGPHPLLRKGALIELLERGAE
ncbi:MAG: TIGR04083 family peptide-modifying radical SAM enzyme [Candidatus Coatesbacteria bacterium]|nr:TIGR04083 family peptide-modifying radical SAM enzyme [Candidatus Coatesbacteria bacterium]